MGLARSDIAREQLLSEKILQEIDCLSGRFVGLRIGSSGLPVLLTLRRGIIVAVDRRLDNRRDECSSLWPRPGNGYRSALLNKCTDTVVRLTARQRGYRRITLNIGGFGIGRSIGDRYVGSRCNGRLI